MTNSEFVHAVMELQLAKGNAKQTVISTYKDERRFCDFLYHALNPLSSYKISEEGLGKVYANGTRFGTLNEVCGYLASKNGVSFDDIAEVKSFLQKQDDSLREIYTKLLCKKLRLGVTAATVNKIIPDLIPVWEVQQSYPIEKYPVKDGEWFTLTQKLNGVRCTYYKGKLYARSGEEYKGLDHIVEELNNICACCGDFVFDGELTLSDDVKAANGYSDNEAFRVSTGIINSDAEQKTEIQYTIFDVVAVPEFESPNLETRKMSYRIRRGQLNYISESFNNNYVNILPVLYQGTDQSVIPVLLDQMVKEDKEGLILNLDVPYQRKRHRGILKIKRFYTMDLPIIGIEEGEGRLKDTLGAVIVDFKGNEVRVGSGFNDEQRTEIWNSREEIIGTLCEVKYKEISSDKKTGKESLQFPIFVSLRRDKIEPSFG